MPRRSLLALGGGVAVVAASAMGIAARGDGPADTTTVATTTDAATTTEPAPTSTRRPLTTSTESTTTATSPTTSTTTTTTIAPIVTYAADIGILAPVAVATPVGVTIPALGVEGPVVPAGVNGAGELDVPPDARTLVWYRHGPTPGAAGSAVIAGHLNWKGVLGVFAELADVPVGEHVTVSYDDGTTRAFVVTAVELVEKPAVAVHGVFARDGASVLRLVTCGGEFDSNTRHYRSNVVVTAVPA